MPGARGTRSIGRPRSDTWDCFTNPQRHELVNRDASVYDSPMPPKPQLAAWIARLIVPRIGSNLPPIRRAEEDVARLVELRHACPFQGLVLFNGQADTTHEGLRRIAEVCPTPLLVASDLERGTGQQLRGRPIFPHALAIAKNGELAEQQLIRFAGFLARDARNQGVQIVFGPVADVNSDPRNPIIATRAFGSDPELVARYTAAYVRAAQCAGLVTCPKHFPGHGNTHLDSHAGLPVVTSTREEWLRTDMPPFAAAIQAGAAMIMTGHVAYPALDPSGAPATLSPIMLRGILRDTLGFRGIIVSDSLLMAAVRDRFDSEGELVVAALDAGIDWLLDVADPIAAVEAILKAIADGRLSEARILKKVNRLESLCSRFALARVNSTESAGPKLSFAVPLPPAPSVNALPPSPSLSPFSAPIGFSPQDATEDGDELALEIARGAIRMAAGDMGSAVRRLPLRGDSRLGFVLCKPIPAYGTERNPLPDLLRRNFPASRFVVLPAAPSPEEWKEANALARDAEHLVIASIVKPAAWHRFGLPEAHTAWIQAHCGNPNVILVSLGIAEFLDAFPQASCRICTFSDVACSQQALVEYLAGAISSAEYSRGGC